MSNPNEDGPDTDYKGQVNNRTLIAEAAAARLIAEDVQEEAEVNSRTESEDALPSQFGPDYKHQTREVNPEERKTNQAAHIATGAYASSPAEAPADVVYPDTPPSNTLSSREQTLLLQAELVDGIKEPVHAEVVDESQTERRTRIMTFLSIVLVVFIASSIAVIGAVCGSGKCGGGARPFAAFETTEQLYEAVDKYMADSNSNTSLAATTYGYPIGNWDVSRITNFMSVFDNTRADRLDTSTFNEDLSGWNVSAATTMFQMFGGASAFNGDLSTWDTSSVTDMGFMFFDASAFNGDLSNWDTSRVTDMRLMFQNVFDFNGNLSAWDTSSVTNMRSMFEDASAFNGDLSAWDTSSVTDMEEMFQDATAFNGDLSSWNTSSVTVMKAMFSRALAFNGDLSNWDTSSLLGIDFMFADASAFNGNLSAWDTSSVTDMSDMFRKASAFNGDLSAWDTSSVLDMRSMFNGATSFNQNLCPWGARLPSNANLFRNMFSDSGCPDTTNPVLPVGPFCHPCS